MKKEYFRILAPFTNLEDVKILKDAGADELYCGYVTQELTKKWPLAFNIINRRGEGQSFEDFAVFKNATELAYKYRLPVYVALNGLYTYEQYPLLLDCIKQIERLRGVKGIIVADLCLLLALRKNNFKKEIHISTGGTCFNSRTLDFYHNLGAQRVILSREMFVNEIKDVIVNSKTNIDTEIFILAEPCGGFIDGFCTFFHCYEKYFYLDDNTLVSLSYNTEQNRCGCLFYFGDNLLKANFDVFDAASCRQNRQIKSRLLRSASKRMNHSCFGCNLCNLYDLKDLPIRGLKIVGRGSNVRYVVELVKIVNKARSYLLKKSISKNDFLQKCKVLFSKISVNNGRRCTKFDCYFSSHWVKHENQN